MGGEVVTKDERMRGEVEGVAGTNESSARIIEFPSQRKACLAKRLCFSFSKTSHENQERTILV